jgi:hypothetical protein
VFAQEDAARLVELAARAAGNGRGTVRDEVLAAVEQTLAALREDRDPVLVAVAGHALGARWDATGERDAGAAGG